MVLIILTLIFGSIYSQITYNRKLQDSIEVLKEKMSSVYFTAHLVLYDDTIRINYETNGSAGDWVIIPVLDVRCEYKDEQIVFNCISSENDTNKCIERVQIRMNNQGEDRERSGQYIISAYPGEDRAKLKKLGETMIYVVNGIHSDYEKRREK